MDDPLVVTPQVRIPASELVFRASRSSGPGGQHANVTASRIEVSFDVESSTSLSDKQRTLIIERLGPVVRAVAQDARSQAANRELAAERLSARLAAALKVDKKRTATRPTRASQRRRLDAKRQAAQRKQGRRPPSLPED